MFTCRWVVGACLVALGANGYSRALAAEPRSTLIVGELLPGEGATPSGVPNGLKAPMGIDFDDAGNMYIVELAGGRAHKLDAAGKLTHYSGDGGQSYTGDGGPVGNATFNGMHNVAVTPEGDVYISDSWNHVIRKVDRHTGTISTVAGTGKEGYGGDGGPATSAQFNMLMCVSLNPACDKLYMADGANRRIRMVDLVTGIADTVAGNGEKGVPHDGAVARTSPLVDPRAVAVDSKGLIYVLERSGNAIRVVTPDGRIHTVAGTGEKGHRDGPALSATFGAPKHITIDDRDRVIVADDANAAIRRYDPAEGTVTTLLGQGSGNPPIELSRPHGVCFKRGTLWVVDTGHDRIFHVE